MQPPPAGMAPVLAGAGRQSWQQQQMQQYLMGIGRAVAGFRQSQLAQHQLALQLQQQQLLQEQAAAVAVSSPAAQQVAGPRKPKTPCDPDLAPTKYLDEVLLPVFCS